MSLHTGRQGAGQGVEEGVNGGWRGPGTHPLPAVQEASKVHLSHLPPKNTQFEFHMQLADMSVCLSAHVCFVFVCVCVCVCACIYVHIVTGTRSETRHQV